MLLIRQAIVSTALLALLLCGVYPVLILGVGDTVFAHKAGGSLLVKDGKVIGSELIGQTFTGAQYLHARPSAAGENGYDAASSSASNLGPTSAVLAQKLKERATALRVEQAQGALPVEMLTASGSGLDPHVTPEGALLQVSRIAAARGVSADAVRAVIAQHTQGLELGLFGTPRVNVLLCNLDLDTLR